MKTAEINLNEGGNQGKDAGGWQDLAFEPFRGEEKYTSPDKVDEKVMSKIKKLEKEVGIF